MNGLSVNAWRDPWHVRAKRSMRRWGAVQAVSAWLVRSWVYVCWFGAVAAGLGWLLGVAP